MYIQAFANPVHDIYVTHDSTGATKMIASPCGSIFDLPDKCDIMGLALADGSLFDNEWRLATAEEIRRFLSAEDTRPLRIVRARTFTPSRPVIVALRADSSSER